MAAKYISSKVGIDFGYIGTSGITLNGSLNANSNKIINMYFGTVSGEGALEIAASKRELANVSSYEAGNGLELNGTTFSVKPNTVGGSNLSTCVSVSSNGVAIKIDGSTILNDGFNRLALSAGPLNIGTGAIGTVHLANNSLTGSKIAEGALTYSKFNPSIFGFGILNTGSSFSLDLASFQKRYSFDLSSPNWSTSGGYDIFTISSATHGYGLPFIIDIQKLVGSSYTSFLSGVFDAYIDSSNNVVFRVLTTNKFNGAITIGLQPSAIALT